MLSDTQKERVMGMDDGQGGEVTASDLASPMPKMRGRGMRKAKRMARQQAKQQARGPQPMPQINFGGPPSGPAGLPPIPGFNT